MTFLAGLLFATMTAGDAVAILLNSASSVSAAKFAEAKEIVERDAKAGKPLQQFVIGVTAPSSEQTERYLDASRGLLIEMANKNNNALAWYLLSMESNDFDLLRRAADGGNVQALNALGTIATQQAIDSTRLSTNKVENILKSCFGYFRRAAEQNDANAYVNLGTCYLRGLGCDQDFRLAYASFKKAADMGHPEAMDYVSACYDNGHGVPRNADLSLEWRMRARALRGDKAADTWLRERKKTEKH